MAETDVYTSLAERHGYGESDRYKKILKFLMTPLQSRLAVSLPMPNEDLAKQEGIPVEQVVDELEDLYQKGVIFPRNFETREYFRFSRAVGQLHDSSESLDGITAWTEEEKVKLWELWEDFVRKEWEPDRIPPVANLERPPARIMPAWKAIKDLPDLLPHENLQQIVDEAPLIAVVSCSCRKRKGELVKECDYSHDMNCLQFGRSAEYTAGRGHGKVLTKEEAMAIIEEAEDHGLVHEWPNVAIMSTNSMCSCCDDCCMNMLPMKEYEVPWTSYYAKSRFEATDDYEVCDGCQDCIERCQFDALTMEKIQGHKKLKAVVNSDKCMGCGVCVLVCEPQSLTMKVVRPPEHIPAPSMARR